MKSIKLFISPCSGDLVLPFAHTEHLQGLLYAMVAAGDEDLAAKLHNGKLDAKYKYFSFGDIVGNSKANTANKTVAFTGTVEWEIRAMRDEIITAVQNGIRQSPNIELYTNRCKIVGFKCGERSFLSDEYVFRMNTSLTVYTTDETRHTQYYDINEDKDAFVSAVIDNLKRKYSEYYNIPYFGEISFEPVGSKHPKIVTRYKNTIVNGNLGVYKLTADKAMLELAYYSGVGAKNPAGFGFTDDK